MGTELGILSAGAPSLYFSTFTPSSNICMQMAEQALF